MSIDSLAFAALLNGGLIGAIILLRGLTAGSRVATFVGALALVGAGAGALILAGDLEGGVAEFALLLVSGPLLFAVICHLARPPVPWAVFAVIVVLEIGIVATTRNLEGFDPIGFATFFQIGFTLAGWWVYARDSRPARTDRRTRAASASRSALAILCAASLIHLAQSARLFFPRRDELSDIVPIAIAIALAGLTVFALGRLLTPKSLDSLLPEEARPPAHATELMTQMRHAVGPSLANPDLRLDDVARLMGEAPDRLGDAIGAAGFSGFRGYLQHLRIERAQQQLADSEERRTSIDAIALDCGFRSRSAFYEAFRKETGQTPGEYRRKSA